MTKQNFVQALYSLYETNIIKFYRDFDELLKRQEILAQIGCENAFHLFLLIFNVFFKALECSFLTEIH